MDLSGCQEVKQLGVFTCVSLTLLRSSRAIYLHCKCSYLLEYRKKLNSDSYLSV